MFQKAFIGLLMLTVIGAAGVGVYDAVQPSEVLASPALQVTPTALPQTEPPQVAVSVADPAQQAQPVQQNAAAEMVGAPWAGAGTITAFDFAGFTLRLGDGSEVYVELGQPSYWEAQPVKLAVGDVVAVQGFDNGDQIHAATVTRTDGAVLAVRTMDGRPLWSGGASGEAAGNDAAGEGQAQVAAEDWVRLEGVVIALNGSMMTVQTADGQVLDLQMGQPAFRETQGVTFVVGDAVSVLGFWQGEQFQTGEIQRTATGERLMLRDPNGRPLWAGPGRNGAGGAGGQGAAVGGQGAAGQGQVVVPAAQWQWLEGNVVAVAPLALTLQTAAGETVRVNLGEFNFWTAQGYTFSVPEAIVVEGFWNGDQFEAGRVTFRDGSGTLTFRDELGHLLWPANSAGTQGANGGGGRQYRGGRS
ncbi:MAG: hypothetical protein Kow0077_11160 [Anaerolineae bacterium]